MTRLFQNAPAAEIHGRGCLFAERFKSEADVIANGGTVVGTPTIDFGATFNGATDYVGGYPALRIGAEDFSIQCRCKLATTGSDYYTIFDDLNSPNRFSLFVSPLDGLQARLAGGFIDSTATGVPRNRDLTIGLSADRSGYLTFYIDGLQFGDPVDMTALSADIGLIDFVVGARANGTAYFWDGSIYDLKIFKGAVLTAQEHLDYHNNTTYNYRNQAVLDLPMLAAQHQAGVQTLDVSRSQKSAVFSATPPTKRTNRGYQFNGSNYAQTASGLISSPLSTITAFAVFRLADATTQSVFEFSTPGVAEYGGLINYNGSTKQINFFCGALGGNQAAKFDIADPTGVLMTAIGVHDGTDTMMYINGVRTSIDAPSPLPPGATSGSIYSVGSRVSPGTYISNGSIVYQSGLIPFGLTPIQAADLHLKMRMGINQV